MTTPKIPDKFYFKSKDCSICYATRYEDNYYISYGGAPAQKLSREEVVFKILNGDFIINTNIDANKYKWQSVDTGEICENLWQVIRNSWVNLSKFHILTLRWEYRKNGF